MMWLKQRRRRRRRLKERRKGPKNRRMRAVREHKGKQKQAVLRE